ncbi:radical SAM protein, partial [Thermodesulfobacteriota bacterium]
LSLLYKKIKGDRVQCGLCHRKCMIEDGQTGYCLSRLNIDGTLYSLIYGMISAIEASSIEDKPLIHFHPGSRCLSVGTFGCNFRCKGCQNHELSWGKDELSALAEIALKTKRPGTYHKIVNSNGFQYLTPEELVQKAFELDCKGIAFTFNEPTIWLEYVLDVASIAKKRDLYTVYVTNSWLTPEHLDVLGPHIDAMALDIKSMDDDYYEDLCNVKSAVSKVLQTCAYASNKHNIHVETRTCIVPGYNEDPEMLARIAAWILDNLGRDSVWHILKFFPKHKLNEVPPTPEQSLYAAEMIGKKVGLRNVNIVSDKSCD